MAFKSWDKTTINTKSGKKEGAAPVIISASRSTDIPAFYAEWFMKRLDEGYCKWVNPFNKRPQYVSFEKARAIVFWTKNARPMFKYLKKLDSKNINYYFTFTVNDYEAEGLEPKVPSLESRIETFKELSKNIGKKRVIWRFDPLILCDEVSVKKLLDKVKNVGDKLFQHTEKLVISFADIECYRKVKNNLKTSKLNNFREFGREEIAEIAKGLQQLNSEWNIQIAACAEKSDLSKYNIKHNKCIDDELMINLWDKDSELMRFLGYEPELFPDSKSRPKLKDKGQRKECGCIVSKDIGQYNTCGHLCLYCYANTSAKVVEKNRKNLEKNSDSII